MAIEFRCPHCQRLLRVPDGSQGKQAQCPQCQAMVQVPAAGAPTTPLTPSPPPAAGAGNPFSANFPAATAATPPSDNPYQAPSAAMISPHVATGPGIYPLVPTQMDLGDVLSRTWEIYKAQLGMVILGFFAILAFNIGASFIMQAVIAVVTAVANDPIVVVLVQFVLQIAIWIAQVWLGLGQIRLYLNIARGQRAEFTDLFTGGPYVLTVILGTLLISLITTAVLLPFAAPPLIAWFATNDANVTLIAGLVSGVIGVPVLIFIGLSLFMFQYVVVDRNMGVMDALRTSWQIMSGNRLWMFVYGIIGFFLYLGGLLACCVGALFTVSYAMLGLTVIYLVITGQPTADQLMRGAPPPMPPGPAQPI
jgi:hypothetical protein